MTDVRVAYWQDVDEIISFAQTLVTKDLCAAGRTPSREEVSALIPRTAFVAVEGERIVGALLGTGGRISWLLCPLDAAATTGVALIDATLAQGPVWGTIENDALRQAIHTARPQFVLDGITLRSEES
jgi:hypothetical protein